MNICKTCKTNKDPVYLNCLSCRNKNKLKDKKRSNSRKEYKANYSKLESTKQRRKEYIYKDKQNNIEKYLFNSAKRRAKKLNLNFNITIEYLTSIITKSCPILNIDFVISKTNISDYSPTLDRIIPELGYVIGNVKVISARANRIKNNATLQELKSICSYIETYEENTRI